MGEGSGGGGGPGGGGSVVKQQQRVECFSLSSFVKAATLLIDCLLFMGRIGVRERERDGERSILWGMQVTNSNWNLTSCQPHRFISGQYSM